MGVCFSLKENRGGGIHISKFTKGIVSCSGARKANVSLVIAPHYGRSFCKILVLPVCGENPLEEPCAFSHPHHRQPRTAGAASITKSFEARRGSDPNSSEFET